MSAIAAFFLIRHEQLPRLREVAAQPVGSPTGAVRSFHHSADDWDDPYEEFLTEHAEELEEFRWSGYVLTSGIYLYLESQGVVMDQYGDEPLSRELSESRDGCVFVFRPAGARRLIEALHQHEPDEAALREFVKSEDPGGESLPVEAMRDGFRILKRWLSRVDEGHVGLLEIG